MKTVDPLLGTRGEVAVNSSVESTVDHVEHSIINEVRRLEKIFTIFDQSSALHAMRRTGSTDVAELQTVVALAKDWYERTGGAFHPALQPLVELWEDGAERGRVPSPQVLAEVVARLSTPHGSVDTAALDLNGVAKGWIADRSLDVAFAEPTVSSAWLSLGGDLVHRGEGSIVIGIENPARPYDNVPPMATVELSNEALATSGGGRRWWDINGGRYSKVLDPRTGQPAGDLQSATVIASTAAEADVLATTCLVLEIDHALALVTMHDADCFLIGADGAVTTMSSRFKRA